MGVKMKKTWLSYLLWLLFTAQSLVLSAVYFSAADMFFGKSGEYAAVILACLLFAAAVCIWFLGHKAAGIWTGKLLEEEHAKKMLECFLVMCLFAAAILYRIQLRRMSVPEISKYYDMATIKSTGGVPEIAHGASYCYTVILSAVLSFSGNRAAAGVLLQIVLQLLSLLLLYFGVKQLTGRIEALCAMAVMAFWPVYASHIYYLTPESFYFFLYVLGLLGIGLCRKANEENGRKKERYAGLLLAGIYTGVMGYLDILGWTLLFFSIGICMGESVEGEKGAGKSVVWQILFCLLGSLAGFLGCMAMDAGASGSSLWEIWETWTDAVPLSGVFRFPSAPGGSLAAGTVLCFCSMLGAVGFWFHREQKQDMWILYLLAATVLDMASAGTFTYKIFIASGWAVLAGIGINSMRKCGKSKKALKVTVPDIVLEDMDRIEEETDGKPKVQLIENPLPLPKKHVRREMEYDRIVEYDKMKFDIEVDETDDFDI